MEILKLILLIGIPMATTQFLYRAADKDGSKTKRLAEKYPELLGKKFFVQIIAPLLFMVVFGLISVLCGIPINVFFIISGAVIGIINGLTVTLTYF